MKAIMETIERRKFLKLESRRIQIEEEMKLQEEIDLEKSLYDEVIWALNLERHQAADHGDQGKIEWCNNRISEEQLRRGEVYNKKQIEWRERRRKEVEASQRLRQNSQKRSRKSLDETDCQADGTVESKMKQTNTSDDETEEMRSNNALQNEMKEKNDNDSICDLEDNVIKAINDETLKSDEPEEKGNPLSPVFYIIFGLIVTVSVLTYFKNMMS